MNFNSSIFCLISGASRGIGRKIAHKMAEKSSKITFLLIARSPLDDVENEIKKINSEAEIHLIKMDLSQAKSSDFREMTKKFEPQSFDTVIIFHNAGHIGQVRTCLQQEDPETWKNYYDLNLFSVTSLNSIVLKHFPAQQKFVVNVTSLLGRQPFKRLSMYGSAKAARDLYFKVLALEEPLIKVLNYSPGMVETDMATELLDEMRDFPDVISPDSTKLRPEETVDKLMQLLRTGSFTSGDIVDYYD